MMTIRGVTGRAHQTAMTTMTMTQAAAVPVHRPAAVKRGRGMTMIRRADLTMMMTMTPRRLPRRVRRLRHGLGPTMTRHQTAAPHQAAPHQAAHHQAALTMTTMMTAATTDTTETMMMMTTNSIPATASTPTTEA